MCATLEFACGRFTNQYTWRELVDLYRITEPCIAPISDLEPHLNFAPMQRGIVVRLDSFGVAAHSERNALWYYNFPMSEVGFKGPRNRIVRDPHGPLDES